jgi:hypothetical protein
MVEARALGDSQGAEEAFLRVKPEMDALDASDLAAMNVEVVTATSIVLGVAPRVMAYRERMARLPEFELRNVDHLVDYAQAAWFAYVTNLPAPEPGDAEAMIREVAELRTKLLRWAVPLVDEKVFDAAAVERIQAGSGNKDIPSEERREALERIRRGGAGRALSSALGQGRELDRGDRAGSVAWRRYRAEGVRARQSPRKSGARDAGGRFAARAPGLDSARSRVR